jgi:hypothetical protein
MLYAYFDSKQGLYVAYIERTDVTEWFVALAQAAIGAAGCRGLGIAARS